MRTSLQLISAKENELLCTLGLSFQWRIRCNKAQNSSSPLGNEMIICLSIIYFTLRAHTNKTVILQHYEDKTHKTYCTLLWLKNKSLRKVNQILTNQPLSLPFVYLSVVRVNVFSQYGNSPSICRSDSSNPLGIELHPCDRTLITWKIFRAQLSRGSPQLTVDKW